MSLLTIIFILVQLSTRIEDEAVKPVYDAWETQAGIIKSLLKLYSYFKKATILLLSISFFSLIKEKRPGVWSQPVDGWLVRLVHQTKKKILV